MRIPGPLKETAIGAIILLALTISIMWALQRGPPTGADDGIIALSVLAGAVIGYFVSTQTKTNREFMLAKEAFTLLDSQNSRNYDEN